MSKYYLLLMILLLGLATLACSTFDGSAEETGIASATPVVTPTLAPTATPDPDQPTNGDGASDPSGDTNGSGGLAEATPDPAGTATDGDSPTDGDSDSQGGDGDSGPSGNDPGGDNGDTTGVPAACPAPGQNLLINPSFEGQYKAFGALNELNHAPNWFPWWKDGENNLRPEFKPAEISTAPGRVHSGSSAQQYFKSFGQFKAGLYQSVLDVPAGSNLQFSAHGQAWSCEEFGMCPDGSSVNPADMLMRVGLDPTGDTNFSADTVIWSDYFNPLDQWQVACVSALAERDIVTVYLWASPDGPRQNQDVYWDDASLVVIP